MSKAIANTDRKMAAETRGAWVPASPDNFSVTETPAEKIALGGASALVSSIIWVVPASAGCALAGNTFGGGGGAMTATAEKVLCSGMAPMREDDSGDCQGVFTLNATPFTVTKCSCKIKISSAGQSKAVCE